VLCRIEVRESDDILHLAVADHRSDLPGLFTAPIPMDKAVVCIGRDGRCLAVDSKSLRTVAEWQAAGPVQSVLAGPEQLWICVEGSAVQRVRFQDGRFVTEWVQQLSGPEWTLADADGNRMLAIQSDGLIVPLDKWTGAVGTAIRAPAPLAIAPLRVGSELALATVDGGLFFVPMPE
jgi:hypothetical protein